MVPENTGKSRASHFLHPRVLLEKQRIRNYEKTCNKRGEKQLIYQKINSNRRFTDENLYIKLFKVYNCSITYVGF